MNLLKPLPQIVVVFLKRLVFGFEDVVLDVVRSWNPKKISSNSSAMLATGKC